MLNFIIYLFAFIIGTFFGSFCTLAVYRIPLKQDITHERSYCPKCKHRLEFLDLIPVFSYIFLGGKCRYCHEKVRIRYLLLEIFFGFTYMLFIMSINLDLSFINLNTMAYILFGTLYLITLFLIAGIDKEYKKIHKGVLAFGIISMTFYIVYLYIVQHANIYRYVIYLVLTLVFLLIEKICCKKQKTNYTLQATALFMFMLLFTNKDVMILTTIFSILSVAVVNLINNIKKVHTNKLPIGFIMCVYNIMFLIIQNFVHWM